MDIRKNFKRVVAFLLVAGMLLGMVACTTSKKDEATTAETTTKKQRPTTTANKKEALEDAAKELIPQTDNVRGNITLPLTYGDKDEIKITWTSDKPDVVTDKATGTNGEIPAGVVTRQENDTKVILTAKMVYDEVEHIAEIELTVKAKPAEKKYDAYVYTYFQGALEGKGESQHIHMAVSKDGLFWDALNDDKAILTANLGTKGARDSYIIRSPEGDRFYLIATDLDANGGDWGSYGGNGSHNIRVWESDDLVNWSDERLIKIAPKNATCMWAPETIYDPTTGEYVVYWSSGLKNGTGKQIYYAKTRDFYTFTEPQVYKASTSSVTYIDTSMIYYNGTYYRFTKNENNLTIHLETSNSVLGDFSLVKDKIAGEEGVEGPGIYQINGKEQWILYMDGYAGPNTKVGYFPLIAESLEDLQKGNFRRLESDEYEMPIGAKHGSFMPITTEEYEAMVAKWGMQNVTPGDTNDEGLLLEYEMNQIVNGVIKDTSGNGNDGVIKGDDASISGGALHLGGNSTVEIPGTVFEKENTLTISLWIKNETGKANYAAMFFGSSSNPPLHYWLLNPCNPSGRFKSVFTVLSNSWAPYETEAGITGNSSFSLDGPYTNSSWGLYTTVITPTTITAYYNGELIGTRKISMSVSDFGEGLVAYLGRSSYSDINFKGYIDSVKVYDKAWTEAEVKAEYRNNKH